MKNFTVAAAFEKLGPDFRFVTSVFANAKPDATGTLKGDLRIFGRGDISISTSFNNGDYYKGIDNLVDKITAAGVKRIKRRPDRRRKLLQGHLGSIHLGMGRSAMV